MTDRFRLALLERLAEIPTDVQRAAELGISPQYWNDIKLGRRAASKNIVRRACRLYPELKDAVLADLVDFLNEGSDAA